MCAMNSRPSLRMLQLILLFSAYFAVVIAQIHPTDIPGTDLYGPQVDDDTAWLNFQKEFGGRPDSDRKDIFLENLNFIRTHNADYLAGKWNFYLRMNEFGDLSYDEFKRRYLGYIPRKNPPPTNPVDIERKKRQAIPENLDLRIVYPQCRTSVKIQYNRKTRKECGCCYAFVATSVMDYFHCIKDGKNIEFSTQEIIDCSDKNYGCKGGHYVTAWEHVQANGKIAKSDNYPYTGEEGDCDEDTPKNIIPNLKIIDLRNDEKKLKTFVAEKGPFAIGIEFTWTLVWYSGELSYDALYANKSTCEGSKKTIITGDNEGHALTIVGYGVRGNNDEYWIAKNTWGHTWGSGGYIYIKRNINVCGLADDAFSIDMSSTATTTNYSSDCGKYNPCTAINLAADRRYFGYRHDRHHYVQCSNVVGQCWVMPCPRSPFGGNLVWDVKHNTCNWPWAV